MRVSTFEIKDKRLKFEAHSTDAVTFLWLILLIAQQDTGAHQPSSFSNVLITNSHSATIQRQKLVRAQPDI